MLQINGILRIGRMDYGMDIFGCSGLESAEAGQNGALLYGLRVMTMVHAGVA